MRRDALLEPARRRGQLPDRRRLGPLPDVQHQRHLRAALHAERRRSPSGLVRRGEEPDPARQGEGVYAMIARTTRWATLGLGLLSAGFLSAAPTRGDDKVKYPKVDVAVGYVVDPAWPRRPAS